MRIKDAGQRISILGRRFWITTIVACLSSTLSPVSNAANWLSPAAADDCNPLAVDTCGLPFPSDVFRNTYTTGYGFKDRILDNRVSGPVRSLLSMRLQFPDGFSPSKLFNKSSGFSALGPVLFELGDWPVAEIPSDGEGYLHVYNINTGERVPMIVSLSKGAKAEDSIREGRPVIVGWPVTRFEFGERYLAVLLKDQLNADDGTVQELFTPTAGVTNALNKNAGFRRNLAYQDPLEAIDALGIPHEDILSFTWFTVRKESEVVQPMLDMVEKSLAGGGIMTDMEVSPNQLGDKDAGLVTLQGNLRIVNFRAGEDGGVYPPFDAIYDFARRNVQFKLTLPKVDDGTPIPVAIWGHGLGSGKDFNTTKGNFELGDQLGMATIGIDHPNHGTRVTPTGTINNPLELIKEPYVGIAISSPKTIMQLLGMFVQGVVDQNVLIHGIKNNLPNVLNQWHDDKYPSVPTLDVSNVVYDGISLGAMIGSAVGATAKDLQGVYLVNGAGSLAQAMVGSTFWPATSNVIPQNINGAELMFVLAMIQHYLDIADGNNFTQFYRNPPTEEYSERAVGLHYALGDGSFPNSASLATAQLIDLPAVKVLEEPIASLRYGDTGGLDFFENGFGVVQSGYGFDVAEVALDGFLEGDIESIIGLSGLGGFNVAGNVFSGIGIGSQYEEYINTVLGEDRGSFDDYVERLYSGNAESFLTHFNRGGENARHRQIEWRCSLLNLDSQRCAAAKLKATEDAERIARGELVNEDQNLSGKDRDRDLTKAINDGLNNIQVTEGSGGSLSWTSLLMLLGLWRVSRPRRACRSH